MIIQQQSKVVFTSIHMRSISKFIIWDMVGGMIVFMGIKATSDNTFFAFGSSFVTIEGVNQLLKHTKTGQKIMKKGKTN
ncbi:MAG: hypothetical protein ACI35O_04250 [Bacillaceae bacterium]